MNTNVVTTAALNKHLKDLQRALLKQQDVLLSRIYKAATPADADALMREMHEVNFRVMICGSLLFKHTTAELNNDLVAVTDATKQLEQAIKAAESIAAVIDATSKLLGLVDEVLDLVKLG